MTPSLFISAMAMDSINDANFFKRLIKSKQESSFVTDSDLA